MKLKTFLAEDLDNQKIIDFIKAEAVKKTIMAISRSKTRASSGMIDVDDEDYGEMAADWAYHLVKKLHDEIMMLNGKDFQELLKKELK